MKQDISFKNNKGQTLMGVLYVPEKKFRRKFPAVIVCHGLGGNKDAKNKVDLAEALHKEDFIALRFDFTGHGKSEGDYSDTTVSQEVADIKSAIEALYSLDRVDRKKLGLVGHSLGGTVAIIEAATDSRIKNAVSIAGVADMIKPLNFFVGANKIKKWSALGTLHVEGGDLKYSFLADFKKYNIIALAKKIKIPFLVVHGLHDTWVGMCQAKAIAKSAKSQLKVVDEGHIFGEKSIEPVVSFFKKTLKR